MDSLGENKTPLRDGKGFCFRVSNRDAFREAFYCVSFTPKAKEKGTGRRGGVRELLTRYTRLRSKKHDAARTAA